MFMTCFQKIVKIFSRCNKKNQKMKWTWHETQLPFHIILISKYNSYLQTIEYIYNEKDVKYKKSPRPYPLGDL